MRVTGWLVLAFLSGFPAAAQTVGSQDVISSALQDEISACIHDRGTTDELECFDRPGVTAAARDLARAIATNSSRGMPGMLSGFFEAGAVDVAEIFFPTMANTNFQMALVNASDGPHMATDLTFSRVPAAVQATRAMLARYPRAVETGRVSVVHVRQLPAGGQRFVLVDIVTDGCRACEPVASSLHYADFFNGSLRGSQVLGWQPLRQPTTVSDAERIRQGDVALIQDALNHRGYDAGSVDGVAGSQTRAALGEFRREYCLPEDNRNSDVFVSSLQQSAPPYRAAPCAPGTASGLAPSLPFPDGDYAADLRLCPPAAPEILAQFGDQAYSQLVAVENGTWSWGESICDISRSQTVGGRLRLDLDCIVEGTTRRSITWLDQANSSGFVNEGRSFIQCNAQMTPLNRPGSLFDEGALAAAARAIGSGNCGRECRSGDWSLRVMPLPDGAPTDLMPDLVLYLVSPGNMLALCGAGRCPEAILARHRDQLSVVAEDFNLSVTSRLTGETLRAWASMPRSGSANIPTGPIGQTLPAGILPIPEGIYAHDARLCPGSREQAPNEVVFEAGARPLFISGSSFSWDHSGCEITSARQSGPDWTLDLSCHGENTVYQTRTRIRIMSETTVFFEGFEREWCGPTAELTYQEISSNNELPEGLQEGVYAFDPAGCPSMDGTQRAQRQLVASNMRVTLRDGVFTQGSQTCPISRLSRTFDHSFLEMDCLHSGQASVFLFEMWPMSPVSFINGENTYRLCATASVEPSAPVPALPQAEQPTQQPPSWTPATEASMSGLSLGREGVRDIQARLLVLGFDPNGIDGAAGSGTRSAISAWQRSRGIPETGYLDVQQRNALQLQSAAALETWLMDPDNQRRYEPPPPVPITAAVVNGRWSYTSTCGRNSQLPGRTITGEMQIAYSGGSNFSGALGNSQGLRGNLTGTLSGRQLNGRVRWGILIGSTTFHATISDDGRSASGQDSLGCGFRARKR